MNEKPSNSQNLLSEAGEMAQRASHAGQRLGMSRPAFLRVFEIHRFLQEGNYPNCNSLAKEIEVTPKTIQRDINFMRDQLGFPLEYDPLKRGYWYTREVNEFPLLHLSRNDLVALFLARHALEPLRGTGLERMLTESFRKIAQACPGEVSIQWHELDEAFSVKATGVLMADVALFGQLMDAVKSRREIRFEYQKLTVSSPEARRVQPYHVGQIEHGWYLLAWDGEREAMRTFALQRIRHLELLETVFVRDPQFRAEDQMGAGFGVWSYHGADEAEYEVCIMFEGYAARVVSERQWHASQEIKLLKPDGSEIEFRVKLHGLEEITRWVLSWGSKARVMGPEALRERVRGEAEQMVAHFT